MKILGRKDQERGEERNHGIYSEREGERWKDERVGDGGRFSSVAVAPHFSSRPHNDLTVDGARERGGGQTGRREFVEEKERERERE